MTIVQAEAGVGLTASDIELTGNEPSEVYLLPVFYFSLSAVPGVLVHSDVPRVGQIGFGDDTLTGLQRAVLWSQRTNLMSIPVDCPQRDERLGWLADAQVSAAEATKNFDMAAFYSQFVQNIADSRKSDVNTWTVWVVCQACSCDWAEFADGSIPDFVPDCDEEDNNPLTICNRSYTFPGDAAWTAALPVITWETYRASGDVGVLQRMYPALQRYIANEETRVDPGSGLLTASEFGDWNAIFKV